MLCRARGGCGQPIALVERVAKILHESDLCPTRKTKPESVSQRKGEIAVSVHRAQLFTSAVRAEVPELAHAGGHLDHLMESDLSARVKECLERQNVPFGLAGGRVRSAANLERQTREAPDDAERGSPADSVFQGATPPEAIGEDPVRAGPSIRHTAWIDVAGPDGRREHGTACARQLENLSGCFGGDAAAGDDDGQEMNE